MSSKTKKVDDYIFTTSKDLKTFFKDGINGSFTNLARELVPYIFMIKSIDLQKINQAIISSFLEIISETCG